METVYDWVTVAIFAGLIVLFLQRSVGPERDQLWLRVGAADFLTAAEKRAALGLPPLAEPGR